MDGSDRAAAVSSADSGRGRCVIDIAVCVLQPDGGAVPNASGDVRLAQVAAAFLGKQMEE